MTKKEERSAFPRIGNCAKCGETSILALHRIAERKHMILCTLCHVKLDRQEKASVEHT